MKIITCLFLFLVTTGLMTGFTGAYYILDANKTHFKSIDIDSNSIVFGIFLGMRI